METEVEMEGEKQLLVNSWGYKLRISAKANFEEDIPAQLIIKNPANQVHTKDLDTIDAAAGEFLYTVQEDDFLEEGQYKFQILQEGEGFRYLSSVFSASVLNSIDMVE